MGEWLGIIKNENEVYINFRDTANVSINYFGKDCSYSNYKYRFVNDSTIFIKSINIQLVARMIDSNSINILCPKCDSIFPDKSLSNLNFKRVTHKSNRDSVVQILFGIDCGECPNAGSLAFKTDFYQKKLFRNLTFRSWKLRGNYHDILLSPQDEYLISSKIINAIPDSLLELNHNINDCPECNDGGGLHLEIYCLNQKKIFHMIDLSEDLKGCLKPLPNKVDSIINKLTKYNL